MAEPVPHDMRGILPHLVCAGAAEALAFYVAAFDAVELRRLPGPGGKLLHASLRIGDAMVMLADEFPEWQSVGPIARGGSSVTLHRFVPDVDAAVAKAVAAGATLVMPVADMFWGDRYGIVRDPFGHLWSLATHQKDLTSEEVIEAMRHAAPPTPGS
jgi:uncharacterized glyoxalase superfamily protein PhnB